jgi:hypothetical protein
MYFYVKLHNLKNYLTVRMKVANKFGDYIGI